MESFAAPTTRKRGPERSHGFTLIELMVVVAVVAILAAIAYPSYVQYIVRSKRAAAEGFLLEVTSVQQRYLLDARTYAGDLTTLGLASAVPATVAASYTVTTSAPTPLTFTVTATPIAGTSQAVNDTNCGALAISQDGTKSATGSGGAAGCWQQ